MKSYYHAVLFDFDGTLVDTMHKYADIAAEEINGFYGLPKVTARQLYLETSGIPFFKQLDVIFGPDPKNDKCSARFESRKAEYLETVRLDQGTKQTIRALRALGLSMAITSNNFQHILDKFIAQEPKLFDLILGFHEGMSKGPTQFTMVMDTFGIDRRHMLFIGDSISDVRKALAFGIDFVAIAGTLKPETFTTLFPFVPVIFELQELGVLLKKNSPLNQIARY